MAKFHSILRGAGMLVFPALLLSSCTSPRQFTSDAFSGALENKGIIYYPSPRGNPTLPDEWNHYGPGVVFNPAGASVTARAGRMIGNTLVKDLADPKHASPLSLFTNKVVKERDLNLLGGGPAAIVAKIKGDFHMQANAEAEVVTGNVYQTTLTEADLVEACRRHLKTNGLTPRMREDLRAGRRSLLLAAIYADKLTFKFSNKNTTGGSIGLGLPKTGDFSFDGKKYTWTEAGLEMTEPRFLGYRVLDRADTGDLFR